MSSNTSRPLKVLQAMRSTKRAYTIEEIRPPGMTVEETQGIIDRLVKSGLVYESGPGYQKQPEKRRYKTNQNQLPGM